MASGGAAAGGSTELPCPFGELGIDLTAADLRETAYEIFVAVSRTTAGKSLTYISQADRSTPEKPTLTQSVSAVSPSSGSPSVQKTLTAAAASKVKRALGLKKKSPGKDGTSPSKKPATVAELIRIQLGVPEPTDARIRRGLLRVSAGQLGRRVESMVLPLELLQQFKASDFASDGEYASWKARNLKILEAGLLLHPLAKPSRSDGAGQQLRRILNGPLETGKNSESMQALRSAATALAARSPDGSGPEKAHWADGIPLNLHLYQALLEACFDREDGSVIEEAEEVLEVMKKTWPVLGLDQALHNLCFAWVLFRRAAAGRGDPDLLFAADTQLSAVAADAKTSKDPAYGKILGSTLGPIMNWAEQRLLAYHDTFRDGNLEAMHSVASLGVSAAKILAEDVSQEYRRHRKDADVARSRVEAYVRSSLRTAFAQRMEQADSNRRSAKTGGNPSLSSPLLCVLARDIGDLAKKEKNTYTSVLKKWHPLAAGVAMATLHSCYANELKQFISGLTDLTVDSVEVLKAADKLEKDLVQIAVEDAVDSEDGGKGIIREMTPFEAESAIVNLARNWIKARANRLREWIDRAGQKEEWNPGANKENVAPSVVETLRVMDETLESFFKLPIPMLPALLPDLLSTLDRSLQLYASKAKSECGTKNTFMPQLPGLTRCTIEARLWKKKEKPHEAVQRRTRSNGDVSLLGLKKLCVRMNTLNHILSELDGLKKKVMTRLRNAESAQADNVNGIEIEFDLVKASCQEGIQFLCEVMAYKAAFQDLGQVIWEGLYIGDLAASQIGPAIQELDRVLEVISGVVHPRLRNRALTALMKATFDAFLLVILAGGPGRAFSVQDGQVMEQDLASIEGLFLADGDGLPAELVEKAAAQARSVVPLFRTDTDKLIDRFKSAMAGAGFAGKAKLPLPPTSGIWSPADPNTVLRVLCHRNDEAASRFLKKTYSLPKKL